ncbi:MAG TPA: hypothetical protein VM142_02840 [Acidimicrobiales bacterium]|nr:hypothetical protein [Acidimicrobiales bacterium]
MAPHDLRNDLERLLVQVESPGFAVAFRGYDSHQVEVLLEAVATALRTVLRDGERPIAGPPGGSIAADGPSSAEVLSELLAAVADEVDRFRQEARGLVIEAQSQAVEILDAARTEAATLVEVTRRNAEASVAEDLVAAANLLAEARDEAAAILAGAIPLAPVSAEVDQSRRDPGGFE